MRQSFFILTTCFYLMSCGQNDTKETKSAKVDSVNNVNTIHPDTSQQKSNTEVAASLVLTPMDISGDLGQITFQQDNKTIFYFDRKTKKGKIILNQKEYILTSEIYKGVYVLSGDGVSIATSLCKYKENTGEDCGYGKCASAKITAGKVSLELKNIDVQDCLDPNQ